VTPSSRFNSICVTGANTTIVNDNYTLDPVTGRYVSPTGLRIYRIGASQWVIQQAAPNTQFYYTNSNTSNYVPSTGWTPSTLGTSPSPTISSSACATPTPTETPTATPTPSQSPTVTPSQSPTVTPSQTVTSSQTPTQTVTPSATPTITPTVFALQALDDVDNYITKTPTPSITPTATPTPSVTSTITPSPTNTPSQTRTPSQTPTQTPSQTPTISRTPSPTVTPTPTDTPINPSYFTVNTIGDGTIKTLCTGTEAVNVLLVAGAEFGCACVDDGSGATGSTAIYVNNVQYGTFGWANRNLTSIIFRFRINSTSQWYYSYFNHEDFRVDFPKDNLT